ncbi:MAG: tRNA-binding protein [Thaumarchaeota archaeon]|nr:tRNA-binding protein [Nitrososphaerota archaeon]
MAISIDDFAKVELKVGKIVSVDDIPAARNPMYKLTVDFGEGTTKQCVAGIKNFYQKEQLMGKVVVAVVNLLPKSVAGVASECMLLAAYNETELSLLSLDRVLPLGTRIG